MESAAVAGSLGVLLALSAYWRWRDEDPLRAINREGDGMRKLVAALLRRRADRQLARRLAKLRRIARRSA